MIIAKGVVFYRESAEEEWSIFKPCEKGFNLDGWPCVRDKHHKVVVEQCARLPKDDQRYTPHEG